MLDTQEGLQNPEEPSDSLKRASHLPFAVFRCNDQLMLSSHPFSHKQVLYFYSLEGAIKVN